MQEKKKILYVITKGNFGGAQRYVYSLATGLSKDKFEPVAVCGTKDGTILIDKLKEKNIRTIALKNSEREINLKNDFRTVKELVKIINEEKPNIIHLNSSKIGVLGSLAILFLKFCSAIHNLTRPAGSKFAIHSVFTAHGWAFNEKGRSALTRFVFCLGHFFTIMVCDTTIAVSEKAKRDAACLPFAGKKIKVVYNGISPFGLAAVKEAEKVLAGESNQESKKTVIFSIAELNRNKGIDVALKALSILPKKIKEKIIFCVAGNGEEKGSLEKLAKELGVQNFVRFLGYVPDARKLLRGADIFLLPSRTEAFPYVILEAGFAELPIIATSVGGVPEIIRDMQNGILIHPRNSKEIAEAILYMLDHPERKKEFGREIKKTVTNFFTLEKMLTETIHIYSYNKNL